jgi:SAM-dependent methyltransferase
MPVLIDGHNLIGQLPQLSLSDPDDEAQLVMLLRRYATRRKGRKVVVVFDGGVYGHPDNLNGYGVEVHFAKSPSDADSMLIKRIRAIKRRDEWQVVTSDRAVAGEAEAHGIPVVSSQLFAQRLMALHQPKASIQAKRNDRPLSKEEIAMWMEIFGIDEDEDADYFITEQNRRSWNAAVPAHTSHRVGEAAFLRNGGLTIFPEERALLEPLAGARLLHLLCNTGQDSLSFAALGAHVTGVDISDAAIAYAQALAAEAALPAAFVCADVYAYLEAAQRADKRFDRIYAGYGVICWLHDLERFAQGVAALLQPGGRFGLVEFHPASNMFDAAWNLAHPYPQGGTLLQIEGVGDYVGAAGGALTPAGFAEGMTAFTNPEPCTLYRWGVGEVVTALAAAGLRITALHEYLYVNGERPFTRMRADADRRMHPPDDVPAPPLMYAVGAMSMGA